MSPVNNMFANPAGTPPQKYKNLMMPAAGAAPSPLGAGVPQGPGAANPSAPRPVGAPPTTNIGGAKGQAPAIPGVKETPNFNWASQPGAVTTQRGQSADGAPPKIETATLAPSPTTAPGQTNPFASITSALGRPVETPRQNVNQDAAFWASEEGRARLASDRSNRELGARIGPLSTQSAGATPTVSAPPTASAGSGFDFKAGNQTAAPDAPVTGGPDFRTPGAPNLGQLPQVGVTGAPGATAPAGDFKNPVNLPTPSSAQQANPFSAAMTPFKQMNVNLPNPNDLLKEKLASFDALNREETQRKLDDLNASLAQRGIFSSGGAEELQKRVMDESTRARNQFITEQMIEAERQTQANARDQFSLNLQGQGQAGQLNLEGLKAVAANTSQQFRDSLDSFMAGESQAGRLSKDSMDRWLASRGATQQDREYALARYDAELRGQGQAFNQAVTAATTRSGLKTEEQNRQMVEYRANQDAANTNFQQTLLAHQEGRATQQQLEDSTLKFWAAKTQAEQATFNNKLALYEADGRLTHQEAQDWASMYDLGLKERRSEQDVMLQLASIGQKDDESKRTALTQLFATAGDLVDRALDRALRAEQVTQQGQSLNAELNAANNQADANQRGGLLSSIGGALGGLF